MKKVLIVDDSALMRRMMRNILTGNGYEIAGEAHNGALGVSKYKELMPDIVTMDLVMEGMSGLDALSIIIDINPDANVIMVSSMGQDIIVRDAIMRGAKSFIVKPYSEKQVMNAFKRILKLRP